MARCKTRAAASWSRNVSNGGSSVSSMSRQTSPLSLLALHCSHSLCASEDLILFKNHLNLTRFGSLDSRNRQDGLKTAARMWRRVKKMQKLQASQAGWESKSWEQRRKRDSPVWVVLLLVVGRQRQKKCKTAEKTHHRNFT